MRKLWRRRQRHCILREDWELYNRLDKAAILSISAAHLHRADAAAEGFHVIGGGASILGAAALVPLAAALQALQQILVFHIVRFHIDRLFCHFQGIYIIAESGIGDGREVIPAGGTILHLIQHMERFIIVPRVDIVCSRLQTGGCLLGIILLAGLLVAITGLSAVAPEGAKRSPAEVAVLSLIATIPIVSIPVRTISIGAISVAP